MPRKIKWSVTATDVDQAADNEFVPYDGPLPRKGVYVGTVRICRVAESSAGNSMIKIMAVVDGKASGPDKRQYDGAPLWGQAVDTPQTAFQIKSLMAAFGLRGRDFASAVADEDDNIVKFGRFVPVGASVRFAVKTEYYNDELTAKIDRFLPPKVEESADEDEEYDEDEDGDAEEYDDTEEAEYEDEGDEEVEDDTEEYEEEEEEPAPPPRRAAAKKVAKKTAPSTPPRRAATKAAPAKKATPAKKAPARRRPADEEPPF